MRRLDALCTITALTSFLAFDPTAKAASFAYQTIELSGQVYGVATGVNGGNVVVGYYAAPNVSTQGFVWAGGNGRIIDQNRIFFPIAINASGIIAGAVQPSTLGGHQLGRVFSYAAGGSRGLPAPRGFDIVPSAINASGEVVGSAWYNDRSIGYVAQRGTADLFETPGPKNIQTAIMALNDAGDFAGITYGVGPDIFGFVVKNGRYKKLNVASSTTVFPAALSNDGRIAGYYSASGQDHGFVLTGDTVLTLDAPGASFTSVAAFGSGDSVFGTFVNSVGVGHGFIYAAGVFHTLDVPQSVNTAISGANANGSFVGSWTGVDNVIHPFLATCPAKDGICTQ